MILFLIILRFSLALHKKWSFLRIWSHLLEKSLTENFIFCAVQHASVFKIEQAKNSSDCFSFKLVTKEGICKETLTLDVSKATQSDDMPTNMKNHENNSFRKLARNKSICREICDFFFQANFNNTIEASTFPEQLKYADVKPVFLKKISELTSKARDQSVLFPTYLEFMKGFPASK